MEEQLMFILKMKSLVNDMFPHMADNAQDAFDKINGFIAQTRGNLAQLNITETAKELAALKNTNGAPGGNPGLIGAGTRLSATLDLLRQIGELTIADEQKITTLAETIAHVKKSGSLSGDDLKAFEDAGVNMAQLMAKQWEAFGFGQKKTVAEIKKMVKDGAINTVQIARALNIATEASGRYYNEAAAHFAELKQSWDQLQTEIRDTLVPLAITVIEELADLLEWLHENNIAERLQPHIDQLDKDLQDLTVWTRINTEALQTSTSAIIALIDALLQIKPAGAPAEKESFVMELLKDLLKGGANKLGEEVMGKLLKWGGTKLATAGAEAAGSSLATSTLVEGGIATAEIVETTAVAATVAEAGLALLGTISGIGLVIGAVGLAAYGVHKMLSDDKNEKPTPGLNKDQMYATHVSPRSNAPGISIATVPHQELPTFPNMDAKWGKLNPNAPPLKLAEIKPQQEAVGKIAKASENITAGGSRQTIINVNAPMYKVEKQVFESIKESIADWEPRLQEALLRILQSANAAR